MTTIPAYNVTASLRRLLDGFWAAHGQLSLTSLRLLCLMPLHGARVADVADLLGVTANHVHCTLRYLSSVGIITRVAIEGTRSRGGHPRYDYDLSIGSRELLTVRMEEAVLSDPETAALLRLAKDGPPA